MVQLTEPHNDTGYLISAHRTANSAVPPQDKSLVVVEGECFEFDLFRRSCQLDGRDGHLVKLKIIAWARHTLCTSAGMHLLEFAPSALLTAMRVLDRLASSNTDQAGAIEPVACGINLSTSSGSETSSPSSFLQCHAKRP